MVYKLVDVLRAALGYMFENGSRGMFSIVEKPDAIGVGTDAAVKIYEMPSRRAHPDKYLSKEQMEKLREAQNARQQLVSRIRTDVTAVCMENAGELEKLDQQIRDFYRTVDTSREK